LRDSLPIDMLLSAVSFLVVAQSSSEAPEGLMNNPVYNTRLNNLYCAENSNIVLDRVIVVLFCFASVCFTS
jgi:hypothetical protein